MIPPYEKWGTEFRDKLVVLVGDQDVALHCAKTESWDERTGRLSDLWYYIRVVAVGGTRDRLEGGIGQNIYGCARVHANSCLCADRHAAKRGGEPEVPGTCFWVLEVRFGGALICRISCRVRCWEETAEAVARAAWRDQAALEACEVSELRS